MREFTIAVGAYSRGGGGLLTICSSRVGAYSKGGFFEGGLFEDLRYTRTKKGYGEGRHWATIGLAEAIAPPPLFCNKKL